MSWTKDKIADLLKSNDRAVEKAMVALYNRQTSDEQRDSHTRHDNQRGFRANHASKGSYYARWVIGGRPLSGRHLTNARNIALHYTQQLADEANAKVADKVAADEDKREAYKSFLSDSDMDRVSRHVAPTRHDHEEREMQRMEAENDVALTRREEEAKSHVRGLMETRCLKAFNLPCFCYACTKAFQ